MRIWRNKKNKTEALGEAVNKGDVLTGLNLCCTYFERNIQNNSTFEPEFKTSKIINSILETRQILTDTDVADIVKLMKDIKEVEHYDGSGWVDYKMKLGHFLRLSGFDINLFD
jgi:hypothetical protein